MLTWFLFVAPRYTCYPNHSRYPGYPSDACNPSDTRDARFRLFVVEVGHFFHFEDHRC